MAILANNPELDAKHISDNLENYEAARSGFFSFQVAPTELDNLYSVDWNRDGKEAATEANEGLYNKDKASEYLRLNVVKASVPSFELTTHDYRRGNNIVHYAGVPTYSSGSITVDDIVGLDTKALLYSWLYLAYDPRTKKGGRMKEYKKTATLTEYTQDFERVRSWTLHGVFITKIDEADFDRENDGPRQLTVNISYDWAEMETDDVSAALHPKTTTNNN